VPSYTAVDLRYGWRVHQGLEFALIGRNLLDPHHAETGAAPGRHSFGRELLLKLVWTP
jgi:iron complex outermembrane receptor protein